MKKLAVAVTTLLLAGSLFSCSANMSIPHWRTTQPSENNKGEQDYIIFDSNNDGVNAGDYLADKNGKVRNYNSDNDPGR